MDTEDEADRDRKASPSTSEQPSPPAATKRELSSEDEETPAPPETERPPGVKRRRFFAQEVDDDEEREHEPYDVKEEQLKSANTNGKVDKGKGRAPEPEVVEILDDTDDDLDIIEAGPSTQKATKTRPTYVARDGKDFKGQKYFGSKSADR